MLWHIFYAVGNVSDNTFSNKWEKNPIHDNNIIIIISKRFRVTINVSHKVCQKNVLK